MNKFGSFVFILSTILAAYTPANAQGAIMAGLPDVLGQTIGRAGGSAWPVGCLTLADQPTDRDIARFETGAAIGMQRYLELAATGADPSAAYKRDWDRPWQLDGVVLDDRSQIIDPWAARVSRLEPVGLELGSSEVFGRGVWRAFDASGQLLGYYDAEMIRRSDDYAVGRLELWSPDRSGDARPVTPYCAEPGDHEQFLQAVVSSTRLRFDRANAEAIEAETATAENPQQASLIRRAERLRTRAEERRLALINAENSYAAAVATAHAAAETYGSVVGETNKCK